jgi:hypothetical protein
VNCSMNAFRIKFRLVIGISLAGLAQFISSPRLSADESPLASLGGAGKKHIQRSIFE